MSNYKCNGVPITAQAISKAEAQTSAYFAQAKAEALLPQKATLTFESDPGIASNHINNWHITGDLNADPNYMACLFPEQIKATLMHEVGHYHNQYSLKYIAQDIAQDVMLFALAGVIAFRAIKFVAFRMSGHRRPPEKVDIPFIASLLICHTANGTSLLFSDWDMENAADHYSAQKLDSGKPLANALQRFPLVSASAPVEDKRIMPYVREYGLFGLCGAECTHPETSERINTLMAYRAVRPVVAANSAYKTNVSVQLRGPIY